MSFQSRPVSGDERPRRRFPWQKVAVTALQLAEPVLAWYSAWKAKREEEERQESRRRMLRRGIVILTSVLFCLLIFAGIAKALVSLKVISLRTVYAVAGKDLPKDEHGFTNFLLLGKGDDSHEGADLTDTIMVASIDPQTQSTIMLSLPRDLYALDTEKMGKGRINELYRNYKMYLQREQDRERDAASQESLKELAREIGLKLNMELHRVILVDFIGFVQIVDAMGGLDVDVPYDIVDTAYPGPNYSYQTFEIRKGPHHLDGETALKYARSRHSSSDIGRSARQQQLIEALAEKARTLGILSKASKITSLLSIISKHTETTMTTAELIGVARMAEELDKSRVISIQLTPENGLYGTRALPGGFLYNPPRDQFNGAYVLLPVSIPEFPVTWKQIQSFVGLLLTKREMFIAPPSVTVLNASGRSGLAYTLYLELTRYNFDVEDTGNAPLPKQTPSFVTARTEADLPTARFLADLLGLPLQALPPELAEIAGEVFIILGQDFIYKPFQDLLPDQL